MPELARTNGKTKEEKEQFHHVLGSRGNHFELTHKPAVAVKVKERLDKFAKLAQEKKLPADVVEEGNHLLYRMPKLLAQQDLRKDYQKLVDGTLTVDDFTKDRERIQASKLPAAATTTAGAGKRAPGVRWAQ